MFCYCLFVPAFGQQLLQILFLGRKLLTAFRLRDGGHMVATPEVIILMFIGIEVVTITTILTVHIDIRVITIIINILLPLRFIFPAMLTQSGFPSTTDIQVPIRIIGTIFGYPQVTGTHAPTAVISMTSAMCIRHLQVGKGKMLTLMHISVTAYM